MWGEDTCRAAAEADRLNILQWFAAIRVLEKRGHVIELPAGVTLGFCDGRGPKAARGSEVHAPRRRAEATLWSCSS